MFYIKELREKGGTNIKFAEMLIYIQEDPY